MLPPHKLCHAGSLYFSEEERKANTTATKSNTPSEKTRHVTDLWMEAAMEDTNVTPSFPGHHEVWTDQLTSPPSAISLLPAVEECSKRERCRQPWKHSQPVGVQSMRVCGTPICKWGFSITPFPWKAQGTSQKRGQKDFLGQHAGRTEVEQDFLDLR